MHTEAMYRTDQETTEFLYQHEDCLCRLAQSKDGCHEVLAIMDEAREILLTYEAEVTESGRSIQDILPIPLTFFKRDQSVFCTIASDVPPQGMRRYVTLRNPLFHNDLVVIDRKATSLGVDGDPAWDPNCYYECSIQGFALSIRKPQDVWMKIVEGPQLELERLRSGKELSDGMPFNFYSMTALMSDHDEDAPEAYSFRGVIENVEDFSWFGIQCYRIQLRIHTCEESMPIAYTLVVTEAVLDGTVPKIGECVEGFAVLYLSGACVADTEQTPFQRFQKILQTFSPPDFTQEEEEEPESDESLREESYPWGTVFYRGDQFVSMKPNPSYPVRSVSGPVPLSLPLDGKTCTPCSEFRDEALPHFCFLDEFVTKLPQDLALCKSTKAEKSAIFHAIKPPPSKTWKTTHLLRYSALIQGACTSDGRFFYGRYGIKLPLSYCHTSLVVLYDRQEKAVIRYSLTNEFSAHSLETFDDLTSPVGRCETMDELWAAAERMEEDEFCIITNTETGEFIQFLKEQTSILTEFQLGDIQYHFETHLPTLNDVKTVVTHFIERNPVFFSETPWLHCTWKTTPKKHKNETNGGYSPRFLPPPLRGRDSNVYPATGGA